MGPDDTADGIRVTAPYGAKERVAAARRAVPCRPLGIEGWKHVGHSRQGNLDDHRSFRQAIGFPFGERFVTLKVISPPLCRHRLGFWLPVLYGNDPLVPVIGVVRGLGVRRSPGNHRTEPNHHAKHGNCRYSCLGHLCETGIPEIYHERYRIRAHLIRKEPPSPWHCQKTTRGAPQSF